MLRTSHQISDKLPSKTRPSSSGSIYSATDKDNPHGKGKGNMCVLCECNDMNIME